MTAACYVTGFSCRRRNAATDAKCIVDQHWTPPLAQSLLIRLTLPLPMIQSCTNVLQTILFGLFAAMTYKWSVLFIILSTASFGSFFVVMYVQICAFVRTRNEIVDGSTRRMVMIVGPISLGE